MTRSLIALAAITLLTGHEVTAQSKPASIQGVWQAVEVQVTGPGARTITIPEPRPNLVIFSGRHFSRVVVEAEQPRPILADATKATAEELRAAWGPFAAEAGTFEVSGNTITMRPIAAKNPALMAPGAFVTYSFTLNGNTLTVTYLRNQSGPIANPATIKAVRVE
jgi:hypothetical protein